MAELHTQIDIEAPAERVWQVLTDFSAYGDWNPFIYRLNGQLEEGAQIEVGLHPPGAERKTRFPTVTAVRPERELRWGEWMGLPGLLEREHTLKIEPLGPEQSRFVQWETASGLLAPFSGLGSDDQRQGFEAMNRALKERAERPTAGTVRAQHRRLKASVR